MIKMKHFFTDCAKCLCMAVAGLGLCGATKSFAQSEQPPLILRVEPSPDNYSYRKTSRDKTIQVMLFGFKGETAANDQAPVIPKNRQGLDAFFKQHVDRIRQDIAANNADPNTFRWVAGDEAFTSKNLNRGPQLEAAKMVGMTFPMGMFTVGGGYTWGEKNPALMMRNNEGMFAGVAYDRGNVGYQVSYLASGQEVAGWEVGGGDYRYQSIMFGTSFRVNPRMGITATLQFRTDNDPLTTGDNHAVATVGTKWRF